MSSGAIRAGRAYVELSVNDKLAVGLKAAEAKLRAFGAVISNIGARFSEWGAAVNRIGLRVASIGAMAAGAMAAAARMAGNFGGELSDIAARTGMTAEAFQELAYAARVNGASQADLEQGIRRMQDAITNAAAGSAEATDALAKLGLTVADLAGLSPDKQFQRIADRLAGIRDPALRTALAMDLFGRSGTRLLTMMANGSRGIDILRQKARDLGLVISEQDVNAMDTFGDTLDTLWLALKVTAARIGLAVIPVFTEVANKAIAAAGIISKWITANQGYIVSALKFAAAVAVGGVAVMALGRAMILLGTAFKIAGAAITGAAVAFRVLGTAVLFLGTPLGIVITAIGAAAAAFLYFSGVGGRVAAYLKAVFESLKSDAIASFQAIGRALAAGDLAAAVKVVWALIKMEWIAGTSWLLTNWAETRAAFLRIWSEASAGLAKGMVSAYAAIQTGWLNLVTAMSEAWTLFAHGVGDTWDTVVGWILKRWADLRGAVDKGFDADAEKKRIEIETREKKAAREKETGEALAKTEAEARARKEAIDKNEREMREGIDDATKRELAGIERRRKAQADAAKAEADRAREEWRKALEEAGRAGQTRPGETPESPREGTPDYLGQTRTQMPAAVMGTFSAAGAMRAGSTMSPTLSVLQASHRVLIDIRNRTRPARWSP